MNERTPLLVLGLGNLLLEDDGVGSAAIRLLHERYTPPDGTRVIDGGTLGLALLPYLEDADSVILVDAVDTGGPPAEFVRLDGDEVGPAVATRLSPHQVGVADLLDGARWLGRYPKHLVLLGLVPASMELSVELSPDLRRALPGLVTKVVEEAQALGFAFHPKGGDDAPDAVRAAADGDHVVGLRP
jgi:hydrogenase maturation protease